MTDIRFTRLAGAGALVAAVLLLGASLVPTGSDAGPSPSYAALRPVFEEGAAKGQEDGVIEVFQFHQPDPSAWFWVRTNPATGDREVWKVLHDTFVQPEPGNPIPTDYLYRVAPPVGTVAELLAWIVDHYEHVLGLDELTVLPD